MENGSVSLKTCILLLSLLLATGHASAQSILQSLTVHAPFAPETYQPLDAHQRWQRWINEDGRSGALHIESIGTAAYCRPSMFRPSGTEAGADLPAAWEPATAAI